MHPSSSARFPSGLHRAQQQVLTCVWAGVCRDFPRLWGRSFQRQLAKQGWLPALGSAQPAHQLLWPGSCKPCAQGKPPLQQLCPSTSGEHFHVDGFCWAIIAWIRAAGALTAGRTLYITWSAHLPCLASGQSLQFPHRLQDRCWEGGWARRGWAGEGIGGCRSPGVQACIWVCRRRTSLWTLRIGPLMERRGLWMVQLWAGSCCKPPRCCHSPAVLGVLVGALKGAVDFRVAL